MTEQMGSAHFGAFWNPGWGILINVVFWLCGHDTLGEYSTCAAKLASS